jgi:hypothetical protein
MSRTICDFEAGLPLVVLSKCPGDLELLMKTRQPAPSGLQLGPQLSGGGFGTTIQSDQGSREYDEMAHGFQ